MSQDKKMINGKETPIPPKTPDTITNKTVNPNSTDHKLLNDISNSFNSFNILTRQTGNLIKDYANIIKLLPYINLAKEIIVSSIMSPKDMISIEIHYSVTTDKIKNNTISAATSLLKQYFTKNYKLQEKIKTILENALFDQGAHCTLILPESIVDNVINSQLVSKESFNIAKKYFNSKLTDHGSLKSIGILGSGKDIKETKKFSLESYQLKSISSEEQKIAYKDDNGKYINIENIQVTDDVDLLKLPQIISKISNENVTNIYKRKFNKDKNISLENSLSADIKELYKNRSRSSSHSPIISIPTLSEIEAKSIGEPLIKNIPMESIIPIFKPGNEEDHIGYYIVLGENGNPIDTKYDTINYNNLGKNTLGSYLEKRAGAIFNGNYNSNNTQHREQVNKIYASIIETDLVNRLKNGIYNDEFVIAKNNEVYNLMLSRTLSGKSTQLLFVPKAFLSYIAYQYNENGIGKSLLEDVLILCQLSLVTRLANILLGIKNSINTTNIRVKLEPNDADPKKTIEEIKHLYNGSDNINLFPSLSNVPDIVQELNKAGVLWSFSGNTKIPDIEINKEYVQSNFSKVEQETLDNLKKDILAGMYLTTEMVDQGFGGNFAYTDMANNALFTKRMISISSKIVPQITNLCRMLISYDYNLRDELYKLIETNYKEDSTDIDIGIKSNNESDIIEDAIEEIINSFNIDLPKPPSVSIKRHSEELQDYIDLVDRALDHHISDKLYTSDVVGEELASKINSYREVIKSYYVRKFMSDKGIASELFELSTLNENGNITSNYRQNSEDVLKTIIGSSVILEERVLGLIETINKKSKETKKIKDSFTNGDTDSSSMNNEEIVEDNSSDILSEDDSLPALDETIE